jgi:ABC-type bacteriocin/lantibiotic exporter with double-glycine peptidase domain
VISPAYLQRAVFIVILSFVFFLATMFVYYIRQNVLYFLLASAFLFIYLLTLFSWVMQRRNQLQIFENGLKYKKQSARWDEIAEVSNDGSIKLHDGKQIAVPNGLSGFDELLSIIRSKLS